MEVCFLMVEKALSGFVTIVTLRPYSVNERVHSIQQQITHTQSTHLVASTTTCLWGSGSWDQVWQL